MLSANFYPKKTRVIFRSALSTVARKFMERKPEFYERQIPNTDVDFRQSEFLNPFGKIDLENDTDRDFGGKVTLNILANGIIPLRTN